MLHAVCPRPRGMVVEEELRLHLCATLGSCRAVCSGSGCDAFADISSAKMRLTGRTGAVLSRAAFGLLHGALHSLLGTSHQGYALPWFAASFAAAWVVTTSEVVLHSGGRWWAAMLGACCRGSGHLALAWTPIVLCV